MKCVLLAGVIATVFAFGGALKCYHSIATDESFNKSDLSIACPQSSDRCVKVSSGLKNGLTLVLRSCTKNSSSFLEDSDKLIQNKTLSYLYQDYCDSDNCNDAQSIIAIFLTVFTSLFVSIFANY